MSGLEPERLTWAVLLSRWTEFARSAVALPDAGDPGRVRQSVTDIITLQAVWFALSHLDELPPDQRRLGIDRGGVLIARHAGAIRARFEGRDMPAELAELIHDAEAKLHQAKTL